MRRGIELVSIVIFVVVLASLLGSYTRGVGVPLGLSEVAAQEDHGDGGDDGGDDFDDGHDDGGDDFDDGHDDGGDDFDDGHDDGGDDHDGGPLGDLDRAGREVISDCYDCGRFIDPDCPKCGGYIDGDPTFVPGPKVFDNAVGLWYVIPEAGTDYDPLAVVIHDSGSETDFFDHDGDHDFDQVTTRFLDPGRNRLFDSDSIQFYDPETGEVIDPDSAQASGGGFNYTIRSDDALSAYQQALGILPDELDRLPDLAAELAQKLDFRGFQDLGSETVLSIFVAMGREAFATSDGTVMAGILNALDTFAFEELGGDQVFEAVGLMQGEDFQGMSGDQTSLIFETIGIEQVVNLDAPVIAGMVGLFDPDKFQELGGEQVVQIVGALGEGELEELGEKQALSITESLNVEQIGTVESGQISGLIKAINANDIGTLGESKLEAIIEGLEIDGLSVLEQEKAGEIFEGVGDSVILSLPDDSKDAALDALDANFFDRGTRFSIDLPQDTLIEQLELETPRELADLLKNIAFIRSIECASAGNCQGVVDRGRAGPTTFNLTATSSAGGTVDPSGTTGYNAGDFVIVTATPDAGFRFSGWSGNCSGSSDCLLTMDEDKSVTASFNAVDDYGDTIEAATPVGPDSVTSGTVETDGDIDFFSFSAVAGKPYLFEVALNSLPNSALEVFDASGSSLNSNDDVRPDILSSLIRFISTTSQTVFLGVSGSASTDRGSYVLSVFTDDYSDNLAFLTPIEPDSVTPGEIEAAFDVDIFSFSVTTGQTYIFEGTAGTLTSVGLVITDLAQNLIARNTSADSGIPLEFTAEVTGTLIISVLSPGTGTYTLGFSIAPPPVVSSPPPATADSKFAGEWTGSYTGTFINGACFTNVDGEATLSISQSGDQVFVSFDILQSRITYGPSCSVEGRENEGAFVVATVDGTSATSNEGFNKVNFNNAESPTLMAGEFDFRNGDFGSMGNFTAIRQN